MIGYDRKSFKAIELSDGEFSFQDILGRSISYGTITEAQHLRKSRNNRTQLRQTTFGRSTIPTQVQWYHSTKQSGLSQAIMFPSFTCMNRNSGGNISESVELAQIRF